MTPYCLHPSDTLCFVHIPKTGGTSFIALLDAQFHRYDICPSQLWIHLANHPFLSSDYRLARGHFAYDDYTRFIKSPVYISMFRHPVKRFISEYNFMNDYPGVWKQYLKELDKIYEFDEQAGQAFEQYTERYRKAVTLTLDEFIRDPLIQETAQNVQIRSLTRATTDMSAFNARALMPVAEERLHSLTYFGVLEQFEASMAMLSYTFGWHPILQYQKLMVARSNSYSKGISTATIDYLEDMNRPDLEFYETVKLCFAQRFSDMQSDLARRYPSAYSSRSGSWLFRLLPKRKTGKTSSDRNAGLNSLNKGALLSLKKALDAHYCDYYRDRSLPKQSIIDLCFDQPIDGSGWHLREGNPETDTLIRWMGPGTTSILDLPLSNAQDVTIKIKVIGGIATDVVDSLRLMVGKHSVSLFKLCHIEKPDCFLVVYYGKIEKDKINGSHPFTRLTFQINRTQSLQSLYPDNPDHRPIGLAFNRIYISPQVESFSAQNRMFLFPKDDVYWQEAALFIQKHQVNTDTVFAPLEFAEGLAGFKDSYPSNILPYEAETNMLKRCIWGVVHKGQLDRIPTSVLGHVRSWKPVFANSVFVILSSQTSLPSLQDNVDLNALWEMLAERLEMSEYCPSTNVE